MRKYNNLNINYDKLIIYGFIKDGNNYIYNESIHNDEFNVMVIVNDREVISKVIEIDSNEEYILVDTASTGSFVLEVNNEYEKVLNSIFSKCFDINDKSGYIIKYIKNKYNDDIEYLWEKFPNDGVWRNKVNNKWYGVLLNVKESKLGLDTNKEIKIIDLKYDKDEVDNIIDNVNIFPGYHMNKRSWISINLCGNIDLEKVYKLIDNSYKLSKGG